MKLKSLITKFNKYSLAFIMGLMVTFGNEFIRYNPANKHIEYSNNRGSSWYRRR